MPNTLPLEGVTVVALEHAIAAPTASRHLADWGARVIKIERPGTGDFCRDYDRVMGGMSSQFVWTNRSKESLALDLKSPEGRAALEALLPTADVFIQNLAPGAAARMGLDARSLLARFPRIVACDISGYGSGGPLSDKKAYDLLVQCETGMLSVNGTEEAPSKVGVAIADISTGLFALQGILMGLFRRERTGEGMAFETSLFDSMAEMVAYPAYYTQGSGAAPRRTGARHSSIVPYGPFTTADGTVFFGVQNEREWAALCSQVLGDAGLATDARFCSAPARLAHRAEVEGMIDARLAAWSTAEVITRLDAAGIANARLNTMEAFLKHPQLHARGRVRVTPTPLGEVRTFLPAVTVVGVEPVMGGVPGVGE